jgi:NAD-dependent deacetylase
MSQPFTLDPALRDRVHAAGAGRVVVLTGAGISAESGIPTFRGKEGYWTVGSREYHPQELATWEAFSAMPWEVWAWYLYRRGVCRRASPNPAHAAVVALDAAIGERLTLITQNVDGLHRRAGSPAERTYEIHGNLDRMRCAAACVADSFALPDDVPDLGRGPATAPPGDDASVARGGAVDAATRRLLACPRCGGPARPHVLWFDETYDEPRYRLDSSRRAAAAADLLIVVGTSAQTNLPWQVVRIAAGRGAVIVDVNVEANPFAEIAEVHGGAIRAPAALAVPALVTAIG